MTSKLPKGLRPALFNHLVDRLPPSAAQPVAKDIALSKLFGADVLLTSPLTPSLSVVVPSLTAAVRGALSGSRTARLAFADGSELECPVELDGDGGAAFTLPDGVFRSEHADLHSDDDGRRRRLLKAMFAKCPLGAAEELEWLAVAGHRPLDDYEVSVVAGAIEATPEAFADGISTARTLDQSLLMPDDLLYFERLVAPREPGALFGDYVAGTLEDCRRSQLSRHPEKALRRIAFSALSCPLIPFGLLEGVDAAAIEGLLTAEDPYSLLFGFELVSVRAAQPGMGALGEAFLEKLFADADLAEERRRSSARAPRSASRSCGARRRRPTPRATGSAWLR